MKKVLFLLGIFSALLFVSCDDISEARDVAKEFYTYRQDKQNDKIADICSEDFLNVTSKEDLERLLDEFDATYGDLKSFKSNNFSIKTVNGSKITSFIYNVVYDEGTFVDSLALVKESNGYKILYYQYEKQ